MACSRAFRPSDRQAGVDRLRIGASPGQGADLHVLDTRRALLRTAMLVPMGVWSAAQARADGTTRDDGIGRGISLDLARRRAKQLSSVRYDLSLDLTAKDTAAGSAVIRFDRMGNSGDLVLD